MGAHRQARGTCLLENVKAIFASITTFWFTQEKPPDMFRGLKIYLNVFAVRSLPWAPLTEFAALPQAISWIYLFI